MKQRLSKTSKGVEWIDGPFGLIICDQCGSEFTPKASRLRKNSKRLCSPKCVGAYLSVARKFKTPPSTKRERERANSIVAYHIKYGNYHVPNQCRACGAVGRVEAHHLDYAKPMDVLFVCRSCHMRTHTDPSYLTNLVPVTIPFAHREHRGRFKLGHKGDPIQARRAASIRNESLTPERRKEISRKAVSARWRKHYDDDVVDPIITDVLEKLPAVGKVRSA